MNIFTIGENIYTSKQKTNIKYEIFLRQEKIPNMYELFVFTVWYLKTLSTPL